MQATSSGSTSHLGADGIVLCHASVKFTAGHVLSAAMLDAATRGSLDMITAAYASYADGIVAGLDFQRSGEDLTLTPGLVKWRTDAGASLLFSCCQSINLSACVRACEGPGELLQNGTYKFVLHPLEKSTEHDIETQTLQLALLPPEKEPTARDFLLLRFRGRDAGSMLRLPNTLVHCTHDYPVDFIDVLYATQMGNTTFVPLIFRMIRTFLQQKKARDFLDNALLMQLSSAPVVPLSTLRWYAEGKGVRFTVNAKSRQAFLQTCVLPALQKTMSFPSAATASKKTPLVQPIVRKKTSKMDDDW